MASVMAVMLRVSCVHVPLPVLSMLLVVMRPLVVTRVVGVVSVSASIDSSTAVMLRAGMVVIV